MDIVKKALLISLPILGVCATVLYILHKKEEDDLHETLQDIKTARMKIIETKIPESAVAVVIGRGGSNIKEIQEQTNTKINFKDKGNNEEFRTLFIKGTAEAAQMAETIIHDIVNNQPIIEVETIFVPQKSTGRIIGRGGESVRTISRTSNAKIKIDGDRSLNNIRGRQASSVKEETKIILTGTREQINHAIVLIEEKVEEEMEMSRRLEICQVGRSPRNKPKGAALYLTNSEKPVKNEKWEALQATGSDGVLSVFVSAVDTPSCFWVQVFNPRAVELDHLLSEMTDYYSVEETRKLHAIDHVSVGQIVAAPFVEDDRWYRAEVKDVEVNDLNDNDTRIDLYYVDYGDSDYRKKSDVCQLRTDFLKLRFQAIECSLAKVKPSEGEQWSVKACELFEELTHVAQWKVLCAKVVSCDQLPRGRREGSPVPSISLFDTSTSEDINIAEELVKQGHAMWETSHNSSGTATPNNYQNLSGASTPVKRNTHSPEPSYGTTSAASSPIKRNVSDREHSSDALNGVTGASTLLKRSADS